MSFGSKLKQYRLKLGLSQDELAKKLNTTKQVISRYENEQRSPKISVAVEIAEKLGLPLDSLIDDRKDLDLSAPRFTEDYVTFPVLYDVAAGFDQMADAIDEWEGETIDIPRSYIHGEKDDYAVIRVKGDSMYPDYRDGDKVLLKKQPTLDYSGQVGVLVYEDCATLKRVDFVMGEDWLIMRPINPNFPPQRIEGVDLETCRIVGVPKLLVRKIVD